MFAVLRPFDVLFIKDGNNGTDAARILDSRNTSGAPLNDAAGTPNNSGRVAISAQPVRVKLGLG
jgi:hypothetical protein